MTRVAIVEGDFVVAAWLIEGPCNCGRCAGVAARTLILVRRKAEHYVLDVKPSGSEILGFDGAIADADAFDVVGSGVAAALVELGDGFRSTCLRIESADFAQLGAKLDSFMGVTTRAGRLRLAVRPGGAA